MSRRVLVIGLDSASPDLVFDRFAGSMPNTNSMAKRGVYGEMRSCDPPITIPAWTVMATSKSPGKLGLYGFRYRKGNSYTEFSIASSQSVRERAVWDILGDAGKQSCLIGVTPSYPPVPVNGWLVSGFITPSAEKGYTYPPELKKEIEALVGEYKFDVEFRTEEREKLLDQIYDMTERRYKLIRHLLTNKPWDFFMFVEIGLDRIHHAFWKYFDKEHHLYQSGSKFERVVEDYYHYWDEKIGEILSLVGDDTTVLVTSDHGAKRMKGCFCVNEWLIKEGYLKLKGSVKKFTPPQKANIDWGKSRAWGWGGYYARIFLNVKGREEQGVIDPEDYESARDELIDSIKRIRGPEGEKWDTKVFRPEDIYDECNGSYPDLMVYFDDLSWRSAGTMGHDTLYLPENDIGPDDAVHAQDGMFLLYDPKRDYGCKRIRTSIFDIAPTILRLMGENVPNDMRGKVIEGAH